MEPTGGAAIMAVRGRVLSFAADPALAAGLSTHQGALTNAQVARDLGLPYADPHHLVAA